MGRLTNPRHRRRARPIWWRAPYFRSETTLGVLTHYERGDMARRDKLRKPFVGPVEGGWLCSQRIRIVDAIHVALEPSVRNWFDRESVALAVARLFPMAPEHIYWDRP